MNRYTNIRQLGDGTYGSVILGRSLESGELVAIKNCEPSSEASPVSVVTCRLLDVTSWRRGQPGATWVARTGVDEKKVYSWEECMNLREVKSLKKLNHANVIKLKEVIRENDHLYFIFEYMKENLYQLMKDRTRLFPESAVRNIMFQILQGLAFIHKHGFFHRDMKPENLLCMGPELVKIADFGLAREIRSRPPYTDYVSTRCAAQVHILQLAIDQWAVGCIMAELYTLRPLFPGSSEVDTIFKICQVLGTPKKNDWPEGYLLANAMNFRWPQCVPSSLKTLIPNASPDAIHLMTDLLQWDPKRRPASAQALRYSYFHVGQALGTPQQILEQARPQPNLVPMETSLQAHSVTQQPLLLKPVPPSQPPPNQHCSSRPLQQIQPSPISASAQAAIYQRHTDLLREQPKHMVKPEPTQGTAQSQLPLHLQTKLKPKAGRRRWGHSTGQHKGDEWDDAEDIDLSLSVLGKSNFSTEKSRHGDGPLPRYGNALDYSRPKVQEDGPLNLNKTANYQEPSRTASAKQHYLRQSRYLPGIPSKKNMGTNASKDFSSSHLWGNSTIPFGGTLPSRGAHGTNTIPGGYLPSFYKKDLGSAGQRGPQVPSVESTASNYATWRSGRSQMNSNVSLPTKSTLGTLPRPPVQSVHGRTDWSAKYGHR
ncbi:hypothetical protein WMY93_007171 [Mugilogobius chulae]|uniref:Protein kinase domain-containing protein n=1 Tax=Mugilogobius chulae TaxID=88201 RepID=A0AAW0PY78_9GOBI